MAAVVALVGGLQQQFWFQSCQWKPHCLFWRQNLLWCLSRRTTFLQQERFLMLTLSAGNMFGGYVAVQCVPVGGLTMHNMGALFGQTGRIMSHHRVGKVQDSMCPRILIDAQMSKESGCNGCTVTFCWVFCCGFRWFQMISFCFCTRTDFQWDLFPVMNMLRDAFRSDGHNMTLDKCIECLIPAALAIKFRMI